MERRRYTLDCNWKLFVDNYLDCGYPLPHLHKGLDSVLDDGEYTTTTGGGPSPVFSAPATVTSPVFLAVSLVRFRHVVDEGIARSTG